MRLHFAPRTRATRARWSLEVTLTSSLAICLYLADEKLAPAV